MPQVEKNTQKCSFRDHITFFLEKAVEILKPMIVKWVDLEEKVVRKLHEYYLIPDCRFLKLCELLGVSYKTIYNLFDGNKFI